MTDTVTDTPPIIPPVAPTIVLDRVYTAAGAAEVCGCSPAVLAAAVAAGRLVPVAPGAPEPAFTGLALWPFWCRLVRARCVQTAHVETTRAFDAAPHPLAPQPLRSRRGRYGRGRPVLNPHPYPTE